MPQEIEIKLSVDNPDTVRAKLESIGALRVGLVHETNRIFDTPAGGLYATDCGLRLRITRPDGRDAPTVAVLTFKGPRGGGEFKSREELETPVADADACAAILSRLGYCEKIVYEKRRETWCIRECEVVIDELPELGWFVEIEGVSESEVNSARVELNLADAVVVPETYAELAARRGGETDDGRRELLFKV